MCRASLAAFALLLLAVAGCGRAYDQSQTRDDEAMKRARVELKTPDQAAQQYFLPKYYYDPDYKNEIPVPLPAADAKNVPASDLKSKTFQVPNYLNGMDVVAVLPDAIPADPAK